jgi:aquaporin Z
MPARDLPVYVISQVLGGIAAALVLMLILQGGNLWDGARQAGFAANGFGEHSPKGFGLGAAFLCEVVMTFVFLFVIHGATDSRAPAGFGGLTIGLTLALIHMISIPVTNTSVNPARSTSQALFVGGWALSQLWVFWVAPILGGVLGGLAYKALGKKTA